MNKNYLPLLGRTISVLFAAALLTGCATTHYDKGVRATGGMAKAQKELAQLKAEVSATLAHLDRVAQAKGDPRPAYRDFERSIRRLESNSNRTRDHVVKALAQWNRYLNEWEKELPQFHNAEPRAQSEERRAALATTSEKISAAVQAQQETFDRFLAELKDVRRYLNIDLSPGGITSIGSLAEKARKTGQEVQTRIDDTIKELGRATEEIPPPQPR